VKIDLKGIALVICTPLAIILGVQKIGGYSVVPGYDTHFKEVAKSRGMVNSLKLETDADVGNITCLLKLKLRVSTTALAARLSTGHRLAVALKEADDETVWIDIFEPSYHTLKRDKFVWPSGIDVIVQSSDSVRTNIVLEDWCIYLENRESDSLSKARWRKCWLVISWFLLVVAVLASAYAGWAKQKTHIPLSGGVKIVGIIDGVEGVSVEEGERMRSVLRKVMVEHSDVKDALSPTGQPSLRELRFWFRTKKEYASKLRLLVKELRKTRQR